jgi:hypothetical protein
VDRASGDPADPEEPEGWEQRWPPLGYWVKVTLIVVLTLAVLAGARSVANILILVVVALVLAVGFDPLVQRYRSRLSQPPARGDIVLSLIAVGRLRPAHRAAAGEPGVPPRRHPDLRRALGATRRRVGREIVRRRRRAEGQDFIQHLGARGGIVRHGARARGAGRGRLQRLTISILTICLPAGAPLDAADRARVPLDRRRQGSRSWTGRSTVGGHVYGNLIASVLCGAATLAALLVIGVPFAVPLALWAGFADLIPLVGA